ncbi:hypothetical protein [Stenotrophomonas maltophilia]|uniref:hypothetical protein n=1 Tax=Stenotrophomonas maltophilia TaxID=40324 RepID=UPI002E79B4D8|nr:hypothetical protein [Stenotrophomonas maltophilia]
MRAFRSLCIAIVLFSLAGCDQLTSMAGPGELVSFGYVRPASCERRGPISYNCVMRNYLNGLREANMECAGFDTQGRMVGSSKRVHALSGVTMQPNEERIATVFYEEGAATLVCVDVRDSIPPYSRMRELLSDPKAKDITSVLFL